MSGRAHLRSLVAVAVAAAATLSGCSVDVNPPDLSPAAKAACSRAVAVLPDRVGDQPRRAVRGAELGAAWGDPAIVLRCGVGRPKGLTRFSSCQEVDGIGWFVPQDQLGSKPRQITMTTIGRSPRLEVRVPAAYWPPEDVMADLAVPVEKGTDEVARCR